MFMNSWSKYHTEQLSALFLNKVGILDHFFVLCGQSPTSLFFAELFNSDQESVALELITKSVFVSKPLSNRDREVSPSSTSSQSSFRLFWPSMCFFPPVIRLSAF